MGTQSKSIRTLGAEPPVEGVGGEAPHETGGLGGWSLLPPLVTLILLVTRQYEFKKILRIYFSKNIFLLVFLESSETNADPSLNEIGAKLNFS